MIELGNSLGTGLILGLGIHLIFGESKKKTINFNDQDLWEGPTSTYVRGEYEEKCANQQTSVCVPEMSGSSSKSHVSDMILLVTAGLKVKFRQSPGLILV